MDAILKNNFQNNLAGYELVADTTVSTDTENISFTGLSIGKEDDYMLIANFVNNTATTHDMLIKFNGTNGYYSQRILASSTSVSAERNAFQYFGFIDNASKAMYIANIKLTNNGYIVSTMSENRNIGASSISLMNYALTSTFTATLITSINVSNNGVNMASGSRFQLYKRVAPIIADIIVSTATTSVDITGLNITKDSEYMLVGNFKTVSASTSLGIYVNGTNTDDSYYIQRLLASSTSVSGVRANASIIANSNASSADNFFIARLKLTNNGFFEVQSNVSMGIGSSSIDIYNANTSSTFTATSITSIRLSSLTNQIGIGSRFQLIKLK